MSWHAGTWVDATCGPSPPQLDQNSKITYGETGNLYEQIGGGAIGIGGNLIQEDESSSMTFKLNQGSAVFFRTQLYPHSVAGSPIPTTFDAHGATWELVSGAGTTNPFMDTFAPDYKRGAGSVDFNPHNVVFSDAICTPRWGEVQTVFGDTNGSVEVANFYKNTPIADIPGQVSGGELPEALYTDDLTVASGTTFVNNGFNIYHTGAYTLNGSMSGSGLVIQLEVTPYGDFGGDQVANDAGDVTRFNNAFPSCVSGVGCSTAGWDPLVDWNCDGYINCADRAQFLVNWPSATGLDNDSCP